MSNSHALDAVVDEIGRHALDAVVDEIGRHAPDAVVDEICAGAADGAAIGAHQGVSSDGYGSVIDQVDGSKWIPEMSNSLYTVVTYASSESANCDYAG